MPTFAYEKRLSRIETLRLAITYISFMGDLLASAGGSAAVKADKDHKMDASSNGGGSAEIMSAAAAMAAAGLSGFRSSSSPPVPPTHYPPASMIYPGMHHSVCH